MIQPYVTFASISTLKTFLFILILIGLLGSCDKLNPDEPIPAYIQIDSFILSDVNAVGNTTSRITDAWVTLNNQNIGVFELPALIPVLPNTDSNEIFIQAGIMVNGMIETRTAYPFYTSYTGTIDLEPTVTTVLTPTIQYKESSRFEVIYNNPFEGANLHLENHNGAQVPAKQSTTEFRSGSASLEIHLDSTNFGQNYAEFIADEPFYYPSTSSSPAVMLEIDYKCDHPFSIGLALDNGTAIETRWILTLSPTIDSIGQTFWRKNYINLTGTMSALTYIQHDLLIGALLNSDTSEANIFIDNLKILSTK